MVVLRCVNTLLLVVVIAILSAPGALALSFSSGPTLVPTSNVTSIDNFLCQFTPTDGSLTANITWYRDGSLWTQDDQNSSVTNDVVFQSNAVNTANTAKDQTWRCQVTLNNATGSLSANSSLLTVQNSAPIITPIINQTVYEDAAFSLQMNATDPDSDSIIWISVDQNASDYGGISLFTISTSGLISFTQTNETLVGNHSMLLIANDVGEPDVSGFEVYFELIAVNDAPAITVSSLSGSCTEGTLCNHAVLATDEENDDLNFTANATFVNLSLSGITNFTPTFAQVGSHLILINVTDGENWTTGVLNLTITSTNGAPEFTYNSSATSSGIQNQTANFTFFVNATDRDASDTITFSIAPSNCSLDNPWTITRLTNGSNNTNASAIVNVNITDNNTFVACRQVTITISDGAASTQANFTFNITNVNDAPIIYNQSYYSENTISSQFSNTDMHNITAAKGLQFSFRVNATDVDNLTYEGESWNYSLVGHNATLFQINSSTGLITSILSTMDDTYVGNFSFYVVVMDDENLTVNESVNITIINNSIPVISTLDNASCTEDSLCFKYLTGVDAEGANLTLSLESTYTAPNNATTNYGEADTLSLLNISFQNFNGSATNYTLQVTPGDALVGRWVVNVTFTDDFNDFSSALLGFNITNINDVPFLGDNFSSALADDITFGVTAQNLPFSKTINAIDGDLLYAIDTVTFNYSFLAGGLTLNITQVNTTSATITFTPAANETGNHSLNLSVMDSNGASSYKIVNFTVYNASESPIITQIRPYAVANATVDGFTSSLGANNVTTVYVNEGNILTFDVLAEDGDNASMEVYWYVDGTLESGPLALSGDSRFIRNFTYNESGTRNVTTNVIDRGIAVYTWLVIVNDTNRAPNFVNSLPNLSAEDNSAISGTQIFADFFRLTSPDNIVFLDPDDDLNDNGYVDASESNNLNFSFNSSSSCASFASFNFSGTQLTITPTAVGNCTANFIATDSVGEQVSSNIIRVDILDLGQSSTTTITTTTSSSSGSTTVTETITVPLEQEVDVPTSFKFIYPGISSLYADGTVVIPITLRNTWEEAINGIQLSANVSVQGLNHTFSIDEVDVMPTLSETYLNLTFTEYRFDAPIEVNISAYISSLDHTDVATIYINALERGSYSEDAINTRIGFARDLLSDNPECQELNEILRSAEDNTDSDLSLKIVNSVINGCKYLINIKKEPTAEVPQSFIGRLGVSTNDYIDMRLLFTIIVGMTILALAVALFSRFKLKKI